MVFHLFGTKKFNFQLSQICFFGKEALKDRSSWSENRIHILAQVYIQKPYKNKIDECNIVNQIVVVHSTKNIFPI